MTRIPKQFEVWDTIQQTSGTLKDFTGIVFFKVTSESTQKAIYTLFFQEGGIKK